MGAEVPTAAKVADVGGSEILRLMSGIVAATARGDAEGALRLADRAYRLAGDNSQVAHIYGRVLAVSGQPAKAVEVLTRAAGRGHDPELQATLIILLLDMGQQAEAERLCAAALRSYAVDPGSALAIAARRVVLSLAATLRAACGLTSQCTPWVEVATGADLSGAVVIPLEGDPVPLGDLFVATSEGVDRAEPPLLGRVEIEGRDVLGSPLGHPADFGLDGRCAWTESGVEGWVRLDWAPESPVTVHAVGADGAAVEVLAETQDAQGRMTYALSGLSRGGPVEVCARLPNGVLAPLPDSPALPPLGRATVAANVMVSAVRQAPSRTSMQRAELKRPYVVVPVYRGRKETMACLRSVLATTPPEVAVVVVNDASPEPELVADLVKLSAERRVGLLHNDINLGFPASVNRALNIFRHRDVVILNSDAEVFPGWLERLQAAAYSHMTVGTATALTNAGAIASYPSGDGADPGSAEARAIDKLAARVNRGAYCEVPTGVGHCLYIRRECLETVGPLDADTFAGGYGEETDFCLRASVLGWKHVVAGDVYVRHIGGVSFGRRRAALMARNGAVLNRLHPGYDERIQSFVALDPFGRMMRNLDEARLAGGKRRYALVISPDLPGGVGRMVKARCQALTDSGLTPLVLRPHASGGVKIEVMGDGPHCRDLIYNHAEIQEDARSFLTRLKLVSVEFHHFLDFKGAQLEGFLDFPCGYEVYVHDYSWICPRITLLGGARSYCGEPDLAECETCLGTYGGNLEDGLSVADLRARSLRWLSRASRVTAPSHDAANRFARYFPEVAIDVRPWQTGVDPGSIASRFSAEPGPVRVAVLGAISLWKGVEVLKACAEDAAARQLPLQFVLIGFTEDDAALMATGACHVTGPYQDDEVEALIARERPDLAFFPTLAPETWSYALTHAISAGLPTVAFDIGAIAERLEQSLLVHRLLPMGTDPSAINDVLIKLGANVRNAVSDEIASR